MSKRTSEWMDPLVDEWPNAALQRERERDERTWPGRKLLYGIIILWLAYCCIFSILQTSSLCELLCVWVPKTTCFAQMWACMWLFVCVRQCVFWSVLSVTVSQQHMCCLLDFLTFLKWSGKRLFLFCYRQQDSKYSINRGQRLYGYEIMADTCTLACLYVNSFFCSFGSL